MKFFKALGTGTQRALRSWKSIVVIWFISLLFVSIFAIPAKGILKAGFGDSTITELLRNGMNIDVISDLEQYFSSILAYISSGIFLFILLGVLINSFLAGGLFKSLTGSPEVLTIPCFFRASAKYFWYFLGLYLFIVVILLFIGLLIVGLPVGLTAQTENYTPAMMKIIAIACGSVYIAFLLIMLLVADYARAWLIAAERPAFFKAFGFGFSETFGRFGSSFPVMIIITMMMVLYGWLVSTIIGKWIPVTGSGVFLFFIISQILFFIKILLKAWRYGSVTSLMEMNKIN